MKVCSKCGQERPSDQFPERRNECLDCARKRHRLYFQTERGKAAKKALDKRYSQTEHGRARINAQNRRWAQRNPEKVLAEHRLGRRLRSDPTLRKPCVRCGDPRADGHHEDYSKPYDVIWLCRKHHKERHRELKETA